MLQRAIDFYKHHFLIIFLFSSAILLRIFFMLNNWPTTDSEEGTMGLEAFHILARGEHPIYLYGQYYMGVAEAYIGAVMFNFFGISIFSLRLGILLLFTIFLILVYMLGSLLYNKKVATWTLAILAGGSETMITTELKAVGGALETLVFGAALLLLAAWIALHTTSTHGQEAPKKRLWYAYAAWGLVAGLGLWSHLLIVPFVFCSGAFLLLFCRRQLKKGFVWILFIGLLVGASPLILFNIQNPQHNTLEVVWGLHNLVYPNAPKGILLWVKQLTGTFFYTLPLATGMLLFSDFQALPAFSGIFRINELQSLPLYGRVGWQSLLPILLFGGWSLSYISLLLASTKHSLIGMSPFWKKVRKKLSISDEERQRFVLHAARCMLVLSGWLTILSFATSATASERPWSFRYLIGLLIITPALIAPLCQWLKPLYVLSPWKRAGIRIFIALALSIMGLSTLQNFVALPQASAAMRNQTALIQQLEQRHISHVYSGYWVCDRLIFASQEKVLCSALEDDLKPGFTRYTQYHDIVSKDPDAAYIFTTNNTDFHPQKAIDAFQHNTAYHKISADGYLVFYR